MRIKNDIKQPNIYRDYYLITVMAVDQRLGRIFSRLKSSRVAISCSDYLHINAKSKCKGPLARDIYQDQFNGSLVSNRNCVPDRKLFELEQENLKLLAEKSHALKDQLQSQNDLAQVAAEITPTLNELGGLAHVSAEHWRNDFNNRDGNEFAERLEFTSQYVLSVVQDFADLTKLKTGDITLNQQEIDPNELIKDAASTVQAFADRLLVELQYEPNMRKILIFGDLNRMRQMLLRALFGAIEFVGEDGFVRLRADFSSSGQLSFCLEFGGGKNAVLSQRLSTNKKHVCSEKFSSNWGRDLVARLADLHGGNIVASQDDFGTFLWKIELPENRITVLDADADC